MNIHENMELTIVTFFEVDGQSFKISVIEFGEVRASLGKADGGFQSGPATKWMLVWRAIPTVHRRIWVWLTSQRCVDDGSIRA